MKKLLALLSAAAFAITAQTAPAQEPVSTGMIQAVDTKNATLAIRSDQTHGVMTFYGLDQANIFTADGKPVLLADLQAGQRITVQYAERARRWYISKVILSEPRPAAPVANQAETARIREGTEGDARTPSAPPSTTVPVVPPSTNPASNGNATVTGSATGVRRTAP